MLKRVKEWFQDQYQHDLSPEEFQQQKEELLKETPLPVFWMFGKTGSGKSSVVKYLTGAERATIGTGFRPETKHSFKYAFPSEEAPILEFLDTRGLGEVQYDPTQDIARFEHSTHLMVVTVRIRDDALESVIEPLRRIRKSQPHRPVILALTCLHETYPGEQHPSPDPFEQADPGAHLPADTLARWQKQQYRFEGLFDRCVPLDFTPEEEGFDEPNFGGQRLKTALLELLPNATRQTYLTLDEVMDSLRDLHDERAMPYIMSASTMASTAASVPVPWIDLPVVAGIQTDMVRRLVKLYGGEFDVQEFLSTAGLVGGPLLLRQFLRGFLKVIPGLGMVANAALAFASTFALGKACCWYYGERLAGHAPTKDELQKVLKEQMQIAQHLWKKHNTESESAE